MAFGLAAYVSRVGFPPTPRKARFQVLVRLSWTGFHPQGSYERFHDCISYISSSFPKLNECKDITDFVNVSASVRCCQYQ